MESVNNSFTADYTPTKNGNYGTPISRGGPPMTDSSDEEGYDDDYPPYQMRTSREPATNLLGLPAHLTADEVAEQERIRFARETSMNGGNINFTPADDSIFKTPLNDTKNVIFQSGDPVSVSRQVRHLYNRVKLLEEEVQTQHNRQVFLFSVISVYLLSRGFKWMFR